MKSYGKLTPSNRVELKIFNKVLCVEFWINLFTSVAIAVSSGFYLWDSEVDNVCTIGSSSLNDSNQVNVTKRFSDILTIFFALSVVEAFRSLMMLLAVVTGKSKIAKVYEFLCCNSCLAFAALIILHVYRFQYSGKFCSYDYPGDAMTALGLPSSTQMSASDILNSKYASLFQIQRGRYLLGLVIYIWAGGFTIGCAFACYSIC